MASHVNRLLAASTIAVGIAVTTTSASAQQYIVTKVGPYVPAMEDDWGVVLTGINDEGAVAGTWGSMDFGIVAFWIPGDSFVNDEGYAAEVFFFGSFDDPDGWTRSARLSDTNAVVGHLQRGDIDNYEELGFAWQIGDSELQDLHGLRGKFTHARDVNVGGEIVGYGEGEHGRDRAIRWHDGSHIWMFEDTFAETGSSLALAINELGDVCGDWRAPGDNDRQAFYVEAPFGSTTHPTFIGPGSAKDLNNWDLVVGVSDGDAFVMVKSLVGHVPMTSIGTLPAYEHSFATAVNNVGEVIGSASRTVNPGTFGSYVQYTGFIYRAGTMLNLNDLIDDEGGTIDITHPTDINDSGQIVTNGSGEMLWWPVIDPDDYSRVAYILSPIAGNFDLVNPSDNGGRPDTKRFKVVGGTPTHKSFLYASRYRGETQLAQCSGATLDLSAPEYIASLTPDAFGTDEVRLRKIPSGWVGEVMHFQTYEKGTCRTSRVLTVQY